MSHEAKFKVKDAVLIKEKHGNPVTPGIVTNLWDRQDAMLYEVEYVSGKRKVRCYFFFEELDSAPVEAAKK